MEFSGVWVSKLLGLLPLLLGAETWQLDVQEVRQVRAGDLWEQGDALQVSAILGIFDTDPQGYH